MVKYKTESSVCSTVQSDNLQQRYLAFVHAAFVGGTQFTEGND